MVKKAISLLLFSVLFLANTAFAFYEAGNFIIEKAAETKSYNVDSKVLFVQDYSKILSDIRKYMANPLFAFSSNTVKSMNVFDKAESKAFIVQDTYIINKYEKIYTLPANIEKIFYGLSFPLSITYILVYILSFILLYIGLLRLFNANTINKYNILKKPGLIHKTGFFVWG